MNIAHMTSYDVTVSSRRDPRLLKHAHPTSGSRGSRFCSHPCVEIEINSSERTASDYVFIRGFSASIIGILFRCVSVGHSLRSHHERFPADEMRAFKFPVDVLMWSVCRVSTIRETGKYQEIRCFREIGHGSGNSECFQHFTDEHSIQLMKY